MNTNISTLIPSRSHGWSMGFTNMLAKENTAWWRTRRWWVQCLIWLFFLNGLMAANLADDQYPKDAILNYLYVAGVVLPIGVIIMGMDSILGEIHSGTAAWVLSKPIKRPVYILAKLIAYGLGFLLTAVIIPGAIAYLHLSIVGLKLPVAGFIEAMGLVYLNLLFYMTLAIMLATLFRGRGPVLGITLIVVWFWMVPLSSWLADVMPWRLLLTLGENGALPPMCYYLLSDLPLPTVVPIIVTLLWCVLFVAVAIWRINREEF